MAGVDEITIWTRTSYICWNVGVDNEDGDLFVGTFLIELRCSFDSYRDCGGDCGRKTMIATDDLVAMPVTAAET